MSPYAVPAFVHAVNARTAPVPIFIVPVPTTHCRFGETLILSTLTYGAMVHEPVQALVSRIIENIDNVIIPQRINRFISCNKS